LARNINKKFTERQISTAPPTTNFSCFTSVFILLFHWHQKYLVARIQQFSR